MNMYEALKKERVSILFLLAILIASIGLLAMTQTISRDTGLISDSWMRFTQERSEKALLVTELRQDLGYGGMIHQFKNYVLRGNPSYLAQMQRHIGAAQAHLFQYRSLGTNRAETVALNDLSATLAAYNEAAQQAAKLLAAGDQITSIDEQVKVDDAAALVALLTLSGEAGIGRLGGQSKNGAINELRAAIGYGGMIHEFKNYVLRGDNLRVARVEVKIEVALRAIEDYSAHPLNEIETKALSTIRAMLSQYGQAIKKAQQFVKDEVPPLEIDQKVRVDDSSAFLAFKNLVREYHRYNTENEAAVTEALLVMDTLVNGAFWVTLAVMSSLFCVASWALWAKQRRDTLLLAREKAEAVLVADKNAAETANKTKSEFLASMSHEIRTPMASVMGMADALLDDNLDADVKEKVYSIKDASRSLLVIINDILDISKLEAGKLEVEYIDFHLPTTIEQVLHLFKEKRQSGRQKNVTLSCELSADFPEAINADPTRLRQILINLVGNAMKFTKDGSIVVTGTRYFADNGKEFLRFEVRDTGIGMNGETMAKLFTDFTQADASISRLYHGTGLGLAICRRLTKLMGGDIGVTSELGKGSIFWFTMPHITAKSDVALPKRKTKKAVAQYVAKRPLNILIAEDTIVLQKIVSAIIAKLGHTFETAENGEAALKAHENGNFDLILMDVRMPKMSGPDATKIIRAMDGNKGRIPIVAVTADAVTEQLEKYLELGMNAYVTKPIDRRRLVEAIDSVMGEKIHTRAES